MTTVLRNWPEKTQNPVWLTVGNFDGLHLGHQALIASVKAHAEEFGAQACLLSFHPHPRIFFEQIQAPFYLTCPKEKEELITQSGLDLYVELPFNEQLAAMSARDFFTHLLSSFNLCGLSVGENFHFGRGGEGDYHLLSELCAQAGVSLDRVAPFCQGGEVVSSSRVRRALQNGQMELVAELLGRPYCIRGRVRAGKHMGSKLGFPTANLICDAQKLLPRYGVYASRVMVNGQSYMGVTNTGIRPSFDDGNQPTVETLLLDFDADIYGLPLRIEFVQFLRDEKKFDSFSMLVEQIEADKKEARSCLYGKISS